MSKPSDKAIAAAFWEIWDSPEYDNVTDGIYLRAEQIDATAAPVVVGEDIAQALREAIAIVAKSEDGKWIVDRASPPYETTGVATEYRKAVCEIEYGGGFGSRPNTPEWLAAQAEAIVAAVNFIREHGAALTAALAGD